MKWLRRIGYSLMNPIAITLFILSSVTVIITLVVQNEHVIYLPDSEMHTTIVSLLALFALFCVLGYASKKLRNELGLLVREPWLLWLVSYLVTVVLAAVMIPLFAEGVGNMVYFIAFFVCVLITLAYAFSYIVWEERRMALNARIQAQQSSLNYTLRATGSSRQEPPAGVNEETMPLEQSESQSDTPPQPIKAESVETIMETIVLPATLPVESIVPANGHIESVPQIVPIPVKPVPEKQGRRPEPKPLVPVRITEAALLAMYDEAMAFPNHEPGWHMYGLRNVVTNEVAIYGIIPDPGTYPRSAGGVVIGSEIVANKLEWLINNYHELKKQHPQLANWEMDGFFKGHSHHQLGMYHYSAIDMRSINEYVRDDKDVSVAVGPLVNIHRPAEVRFKRDMRGGRVEIAKGGSLTIRFYYLTRQMWKEGRDPVTVVPESTEPLDISAPMPWTITNPRLYAAFVDPLKKAGFQVTERMVHLGELPLKIQFMITAPALEGTMVVITTPYNYPLTPPTIDLAIMDKQAVAEVVPIGLEWWPDYHLADALGLVQAYTQQVIKGEKKNNAILPN